VQRWRVARQVKVKVESKLGLAPPLVESFNLTFTLHRHDFYYYDHCHCYYNSVERATLLRKMVNKKARKSVALDEATTRAIEQLGALSFRPSDGLAPPSNWMREVTKEEMAAAIEALESDSDEDGGTDEESPNGNKKKGTAGAHDDPSHGQNWIELDDGSGEIHISIYLGDEWVAAIVSAPIDRRLAQLTILLDGP
jgi:hypothetical protein